jgi:hypothetical protein
LWTCDFPDGLLFDSAEKLSTILGRAEFWLDNDQKIGILMIHEAGQVLI